MKNIFHNSYAQKGNAFYIDGDIDNAINMYLMSMCYDIELIKKQSIFNLNYLYSYHKDKISLENIKKIDKIINYKKTTLNELLYDKFRIDNIYVVNVHNAYERNIRCYREMNRNNLRVERIEAIDINSIDVKEYFNKFNEKKIDYNSEEISFLTPVRMRKFKKISQIEQISYILTQRKIFNDALCKKYKRICIFDDDIFFANNIIDRFLDLKSKINDEFKIILLGCSDYKERYTEEYNRNYVANGIYHAIPDRTCGSFAIIYDKSVFREIINIIDKIYCPYDNVILGILYKKYKQCYALDYSLCIPDVSSSIIKKGENRDQYVHGKKMNWDNSRFSEYNKIVRINILIEDKWHIRHIKNFQNKSNSIIFCFYYISVDGIRPLIPLHNNVCEEDPIKFDEIKENNIEEYIHTINLPSADCILFVSNNFNLYYDNIVEFLSKIIVISNLESKRYGIYDGIKYYFGYERCIINNRFSVIIPSFRGPNVAFNSVKSVLQQINVDFEIIIVNDNPKYKTFAEDIYKLCSNFINDSYSIYDKIKIISFSKNRGASAARNSGLFLSTGEYISFLDDDDLYLNDRLYKIKTNIDFFNDKVKAIYCGYHGKWNGNEDFSRFKDGNLIDDILLLKYNSHYMCTNTVTFRRESLEYINGFNESYKRHQDIELFIRFFEHFEIKSIPNFLVINRPTDFDNTFIPTFDNLLKLKLFFFKDMRRIIMSKNKDIIINAHINDIMKRFPNKDFCLIKEKFYNILK